MRIVLGVAGTNVFLDGLPRLAVIEHHVVERYRIAAIVFWGRSHGSSWVLWSMDMGDFDA
jgi:hypothetical protein